MSGVSVHPENDFVHVRHNGTRIVKSIHPNTLAWVKYTTRFISDGSVKCLMDLNQLKAKKKKN
jgi:hypothetical protein